MLRERLKTELKEAMKSGDVIKKNLLRVILAEIDTESKKEGVVITDEVIQKISSGWAKKMKMVDSDEARKEVEILSEYLPKMMSEAETIYALDNVITKIAAESIKDMGRIMGTISKEYGNSIDKKLVSELIKQKFA